MRNLFPELKTAWNRSLLERDELRYQVALLEAETEEERKKLTIARLREHLFALGIDTSDLTDEQVEESVVKFGQAIAAAGLDAAEAGLAMAQTMGRLGGSE